MKKSNEKKIKLLLEKGSIRVSLYSQRCWFLTFFRQLSHCEIEKKIYIYVARRELFKPFFWNIKKSPSAGDLVDLS
jgi:hypothetical protein